MNPLILFLIGAVAIVVFFLFKSSKEKKSSDFQAGSQPDLGPTSSFVDNSFLNEGGSASADVLFEQLPVEGHAEVDSKPKAKKAPAKKKSVSKK